MINICNSTLFFKRDYNLLKTIYLEFNVKKFTAIFICLLMIITCGLAGCAGFSIDKVKYYNEVIATVGNEKITRYELLSAYNSYGQSYYETQQGQSEQEALRNTLNLLTDRESLYQFASNSENNATYKPTPYQVNSIVESMFESFDSQMDTFIKTAKKVLNIEETESSTSSEEEEKFLVSDYLITDDTRRAFVKDEQVEVKTYYTDASKTTESETETEWFTTKTVVKSRIEYNTKLLEEPPTYVKLLEDKYLNNHNEEGIVAKIQDLYFNKTNGHYIQNLKATEKENATAIYNKTISMMCDSLMDYERYLRDENGKAYSKNQNDLLFRYVERSFNDDIKSQYLENVRTKYLLDEQNNLSVVDLEQAFKDTYTAQKLKYNSNKTAYKEAMKAIGTKADTVLYHPTTDTQFGYFIHTLINFDDVQKEKYKLASALTDESEKQTEIQKIIDSMTKINPRNAEGEVDTNTEVTLSDVISEINAIKDYDYEAKLSAFVNLMFTYTGDTATLSAGMPYVVGEDGYSQMEEAFTNECLKLMKQEAGAISDANAANAQSLCITSYGVHIVMYVEDVAAYDVINPNSSYIQYTNKENSGAENLLYKPLSPLTGKTYFDMLFDLVYPASGEEEVFLSANGYSSFEDSIVAQYTVTINETKLQGTKSSL